jgi:hypothetical protein
MVTVNPLLLMLSGVRSVEDPLEAVNVTSDVHWILPTRFVNAEPVSD